MRSGTATKQVQVGFSGRQSRQQTRESRRTTAEPQENETGPATDFLVGALLYSLFVSGSVSEVLPDDDAD
jgi:hypothetical protein